jgi:hypothetical protein
MITGSESHAAVASSGVGLAVGAGTGLTVLVGTGESVAVGFAAGASLRESSSPQPAKTAHKTSAKSEFKILI